MRNKKALPPGRAFLFPSLKRQGLFTDEPKDYLVFLRVDVLGQRIGIGY
jgi:hypothetical protein